MGLQVGRDVGASSKEVPGVLRYVPATWGIKLLKKDSH